MEFYARSYLLTYSEARNNLKRVLDTSINGADVTIIHRRDGEDAVVMGLAHYNSLIETLFLTSSPGNAAHLARSIEEYRAGKAVQRKLIKTEECSARFASRPLPGTITFTGRVRNVKH